jgi:Tfp pilus assembly protein PilN
MSTGYSINLIQGVVASRRRKREQLRFLFASLTLLLTLQGLVMGVYIVRNRQLLQKRLQIRDLLSQAAEIGKTREPRLDQLRSENQDLDVQLQLLEDTADGALPWSRVLQALGESCQNKPIKIRRLVARVGQDELKLQIEAVCTEERPVGHIRTFINGLQDHQAFSQSALLSLQGLQKDSRLFRVEAQLQASYFQSPEAGGLHLVQTATGDQFGETVPAPSLQ